MVIAVISLPNFIASAYTMPADKLMAMSNRELCDKAQAHWDKNELDSALICFNIVANRKQSRDEIEYVCHALTSMADIYLAYYDYERAIKCVMKSEQIALTNDLAGQLPAIYEQMGVIESEKNWLEQEFAFSQKAFELYRKAFHHSIKQGKHVITLLAITNMITCGFQHHKLTLIKDELIQFQDLTINDSLPGYCFAKHQNTAAIYSLHQQYDSTLHELAQLEYSLNVPEHIKPTFLLIIHESLFYVYRDMGNIHSALRELDIFQQISEEYNHRLGLIQVLLLKRDYYASLDNNALADKYDLDYHKAKDKFLTEAKVAKVDEEKVLFKLNEANNEIKELSYKQHIQQTELIAVVVVAVLLLLLLGMAWLSHRRTKEKNRSLYEQNQQLLTKIDQVRQLRQEQERREKEQQALEPEPQPTSFHTEKYGRGKMEDDDITQVMDKVERVMDTATEIFAIDFSLGQLAELTGESRSRLSQAINQVPGRSFYSLLNEYRVREACRRMNDKKQYGGLTIEAIGQSVGFKSRSNFVATFKRITGLTPSTYLKPPPAPESPTTETHAD